LQDCSAAVELLQAALKQLLQIAGQPGAEQEVLAGLLLAAGAAGAAAAASATAGATAGATAAAEDGLEAAAVPGASDFEEQQQQGPAGVEAAAGAEQTTSSSSGAASKLQRQLAKVLARRAAARVELQQLQEAWEDLQQALR
jgi:hypothetical protein